MCASGSCGRLASKEQQVHGSPLAREMTLVTRQVIPRRDHVRPILLSNCYQLPNSEAGGYVRASNRGPQCRPPYLGPNRGRAKGPNRSAESAPGSICRRD
jgi:hypothetical protein